MASHDHVDQSFNGSSSSSSDSSLSESEASSSDEQQDDVPINESSHAVPVKMRIKLSLRMPKPTTEESVPSTLAKHIVSKAVKKDEDATSTSQNDNNHDVEDEEIVQATIVNNSDEGEDNVVEVQAEAEPTVFMYPSPVPSSSAPTKKRTSAPARAVRLPPMSSPGLLIPPSAGVYRGDADANGFTTPASIFDYCMSLAGYTTEARTEHPHRGSSVRRVVGDMFDSNVSFSLHLPKLVPKELWNLPVNDQESPKDVDTKAENDDQETRRDAAQLLLRALAPPKTNKEHRLAKSDSGTEQVSLNSNKTSRKRRRPWHFSEMAPLSLTLPYPEPYIQKRLRYIEKVEEREGAIAASQEAEEKAEEARERHERQSATKGNEDQHSPPPVPKPIQVPPIPEPPSPPRLSDLENAKLDGLPKVHEKFISHLDPSCFDPYERYFGLMTNSIADPNFVGPNAPGIVGLTVSGGTGLATAYAGSVSSGPSASALSAVYYGNVGGGSTSTAAKPMATLSKNPSKKNTADSIVKHVLANGGGKQKHGARGGGPPPTCTSADLKKLMDEGGDAALEMKEFIIRAAVYASRIGKHGQSFLGPNGEAYPDVSKAFAAHAGLRPCSRCKNNKQGVSHGHFFRYSHEIISNSSSFTLYCDMYSQAYHCRLRRKHKDLDYDGGNSPAVLAPLFDEPLDRLILK